VRSKVTLLLLALNLALFGYLLVTERPFSATRQIEENRRRVLGPEAADLAALEITLAPPAQPATDTPAPANTVRLERRADTWFLASPLVWPANDFAVRRMLNELQFLENETSFLVSDLARNDQTLADYGLEQPRLTLTATPATPATGQSMIDNGSPGSPPTPAAPFTLKIGATAAVGGRLYVLSPDGRRIHVLPPRASESLLTALTLDLAQLRSDQLFTIPVFEARALTLQTGATNTARTRLRRDQTRWLFEAPITARAAKTPVDLAINELNALRVARFLPAESAPSSETAGLDAPRLRLTIEGNARRETLHLGAPVSPAAPAAETVELYARFDWRVVPSAEEPPVLFTVQVPAGLLRTLDTAQTELREKRVLDLDPARVTALSVSSPGLPELRIQKLDTGSAWQIVAPAAGAAAPLRADPLLVERLLQRLQLLEAVSPRPEAVPPPSPFVSDAPSAAELENLGFNQPERVVTLQLAPGPASTGPAAGPSEIVLQLARPSGGDPTIYARVAGQPFVYAVPPQTLGQIPVVPRVYRDRQLLTLTGATRITRLTLRSTSTPDAPPLLDYTPSAEPPPEAVAAVLAALRDLRARSIDREEFPSTVPVDGVEKSWAYTLEAELEPALPSGPLVLHLAERGGGSTQLAGSRELGLVFTLEQPVLDALWQLLYREPKP
jgi:hypothetical protein